MFTAFASCFNVQTLPGYPYLDNKWPHVTLCIHVHSNHLNYLRIQLSFLMLIICWDQNGKSTSYKHGKSRTRLGGNVIHVKAIILWGICCNCCFLCLWIWAFSWLQTHFVIWNLVQCLTSRGRFVCLFVFVIQLWPKKIKFQLCDLIFHGSDSTLPCTALSNTHSGEIQRLGCMGLFYFSIFMDS